ncbi:hypothetical protein [Aeromonas veronii]|uniref:hypothetical protein n=1 Tax=Aeromonas veronii TaxID=654 RepID=UPI0031FD0DDB
MAMTIEEHMAGITLKPAKLVKIDQLMTTTNSLINQIQHELMPLVNELGGSADQEVKKLLQQAASCLIAAAASTSCAALIGSYIKD